jgi:two-component system, LytTR family, sensor kinase
MSRNSLASGQAADALADLQAGQLRWSWRLFGLMALAWSLMGLAFYASAQAEGSTTPWTSEAIWRGVNALLWLAFSPPIFFLTRAFPVPGDHAVRNVAIHFLAALGLSVAHLVIFLPVNAWIDPDFHLRYPSLAAAFANQEVYRTVNGVITYGVVFFVFASDAHYRRARLEAFRSEELRRELAEAQLQALRMQIQPHFLFNTLHSIASLIHEAPSEALTMVSRLGDFLRAALERGSAPSLRLEDEIKFAELYLDIQRIRFGDRLTVTMEVAPEALGAEAPSLILQPLVENAIRHGVAPALGAVELAIAARRRDGMLEVTLRNTERDPGAAATAGPPAEGLGLSNTRERLARAYGDRASLSVEKPAPGAFQVTVRLPMLEAPDDRG